MKDFLSLLSVLAIMLSIFALTAWIVNVIDPKMSERIKYMSYIQLTHSHVGYP